MLTKLKLSLINIEKKVFLAEITYSDIGRQIVPILPPTVVQVNKRNAYMSRNNLKKNGIRVISHLCCARGSGDKLVIRKKEKESNKLVAARETSWSHSGR